jgi:1-acyl-sn-glycerol-3-phosphate acyltransferase
MRFPKEATSGWMVLYVVAIIIKPFFLRLEIEGEEYLPRAGGAVVACNHTRGPDYVIVGYASPRQIFYMAKAEIFAYHPWLVRLVTMAGAFPVQRGQADQQAIEQAVAMVRDGHLLGMFPEGTRSRDGRLQKAKLGVARIALGAGRPIVPVVVINSETVLRDVLKFRRRPLVVVRFGPPIAALEGEDLQALTDRVMHQMAQLLPPERRGYYAAGERVRLGGEEIGQDLQDLQD